VAIISHAHHASTVVLAYLDPVSWFAGVQLFGAGATWVAIRVRRMLGVKPKHGVVPQSLQGVTLVTAPDAIDLLSQAPSLPRLIIVVEGPRDWPYLQPILEASKLSGSELEVWCISATTLPVAGLRDLDAAVKAVEASTRTAWSMLLSGLRQSIVLTTLTDLGTPAFPKASTGARYVYTFHSLVSTHVAYAEGAFDNYDTIFCAGPDQVAEIRAREQRLGLQPKALPEVGYPYLDVLSEQWRSADRLERRTALIAPSWSDDEQFRTTWIDAAHALKAGGWKVILRPHPETTKRSPELIRNLQAQFANDRDLELDLTAMAGGRLTDADVLISDWSGSAIEFGTASGRPVVFVDTPQKVRNPKWRETSEESIEARVRGRLGKVIAPSEVGRLAEILESLMVPPRDELSPDYLFNPGVSAAFASETLNGLLFEAQA